MNSTTKPLSSSMIGGIRFFGFKPGTPIKNVVINPDLFRIDTEGVIIQHVKFKDSSPTIEVVYDLDTVLEKSSFESGKAYQKIVRYNMNLANRLKLKAEMMVGYDTNLLEKVKDLHDEWVARKFANPRVHNHTLSSARYWNCVIRSVDRDTRFIYTVIDEDGEVVAMRVVCKDGDILFDAAFITRFWKRSQLSEAANIILLSRLKSDLNVRWFNLGLSTGALKKFKTQFPHRFIRVWRKTNEPISQNIESYF